jgi:hypothetical protein
MNPYGVKISKENAKYFLEIEEQVGQKFSDRQKAWYVKKKAQQKGDMAREFPSTAEEAFQASIEGAYLAKQMEYVQEMGQIGVVPHEPGYPVNTAWDFGLSDHMTIWLHQIVGLQHRFIGYMSGTDNDILYYWSELQRLPYIWGKHFLPHDAGHRRIGTAKDGSSQPRTLAEIFTAANMKNISIVPRVQHKYTAIQEVRKFIPKAFFDEEKCKDGIKCLKNFRRERDEKLEVWKNTPLHNWAQHGYDSMEAIVRGLDMYGTGDAPIGMRVYPTQAEMDWAEVYGDTEKDDAFHLN